MKPGISNSKKTEIFAFALCALLFALRLPVDAQQPAKIPRIGYISGTFNPGNPGPYVEALRQGLQDLGYTEGKHFVIEYRGAEGKLENIPSIVAELVRLKVDVLVLPLIGAIEAGRKATTTI